MKTLTINLFFLISMVCITHAHEPAQKRALENVEQANPKRVKSKATVLRKSSSKTEKGQPIQTCLRCRVFTGYHFQVTQHMHNECFPVDGLFPMGNNSNKVAKMPKYNELVEHNSAYAQDSRWRCVYCSSLVSPQKFEKHFELNTTPLMAPHIFDGFNKELCIGRGERSLSSIKQEFLENKMEAANVLADLKTLKIKQSK